MVVTPFTPLENRTRWLNYLVLSLLANALLMSLISINPEKLIVSDIPLLKIKLMFLKAPEPTPVQKIKTEQIAAPTTKIKKIITEKKAEKAIQKKNKTPKPISKKIKKITPIKKEGLTKAIQKKPVIEKTIAKKETVKEIKKQNILLASKTPISTSSNQISNAEIKEATYKKQTPPVYPRRSLELGQQGNVILHAFIKPDGFPAQLKIKNSSGYSLLDKAALAAVRKWEFEPVYKDGITIASWVRVPIEFVIQ